MARDTYQWFMAMAINRPEYSGSARGAYMDAVNSYAKYARENGMLDSTGNESMDEYRAGQVFTDFEDNVLEGLMSEDNSAYGPKAQALVYIGRRQPEWDWPVGETPKQ